jgi:hypothetical protein
MNHFESIENYQRISVIKNLDGIFRRQYLNSHLALYDVVFALHQFLSHKEKIGILRRGSSVCEALISQFLRLQIPIQYKDEKQNTFEYLEAIDRETNFVIWSSENEITGEIIYSEKDCLEIHQKLSAKRIFSIQILSPGRHLSRIEIFKNQYSVVVDAPDLFSIQKTNVYFTEKFKAPTLIGPLQHLEPSDANEQATRNFDRKIFNFQNVSGYAVKQSIVGQAKASPNDLFAAAELPSWITEAWKSWWPEAAASDYLRGLLVVSERAFIQTQDLELQINEVAKRLENQSNWSIKA